MRTLLSILGLVVSAISIAIVLSQIDLAGTVAVLTDARPLPLMLALVALIVQFGALVVRWRMLLAVAAGGRPVPYGPVIEALLVGTMANAVLPARLGEVARTMVVSRRGAIDLAGSAGTVILERILDVTVLAGVAVLAALAAGAPWFLSGPLGLIAAAGAAVIILAMSGVVPAIMQRLVAKVPPVAHRPRLESVLDWLGRLIDGLIGHHPVVLAAALALTTASVLLDGMIFWAIGLSLGIELGWAEALLLGAAGVLATGIPSAPANVGTFELAVALVAAALGVPTEEGLALALVAHALIVIPLSIAGAIVLVNTLRAPEQEGRDEKLARAETSTG